MGFFERDPVARFLAAVVSCENCYCPCKNKGHSSMFNCENHMKELIREKKVHVHVEWIDQKEE